MDSSSPLSGRRVLLGVTGGIAAYKAASLTRLLTGAGADVRVVMTQSSRRFIGSDTFAALTGSPVPASVWDEPGSVAHVKMARDADLAIVAPATANTIAKLALGLADDLLTAALLEGADLPLLLAPAMHTGMWSHPATREHVATLQARGATIVGPASGELASGDRGVGRMAEPEEILEAAEALVLRERDLEGARILVTAGPTHEPIDPVRFVGNHSSGRMGIEIARAATARGARVGLVLGPGTVDPPPGIEVVRVETAEQMRNAVLEAVEGSQAVVMAAAVADFRPERAAPDKMKKDAGPPELRLVPTPDILRELGQRRGDRVLVGFAAETGDLERAGRAKLVSKDLDLIVVNEVGREGTGFGSPTSNAMLLSRTGEDEPMRIWTKRELADAVCDRIAKLLPSSR